MKDNRYYINKAIEQLKGQVEIGCIVAHPSDKSGYKLVDIINNVAFFEREGIRKNFPLNEVFDANKVKNLAIKLKIYDMLYPSRDN